MLELGLVDRVAGAAGVVSGNRLAGYGAGVGGAIVATLLVIFVRPYASAVDVSLVYLLLVLLCAAAWGLGPGIAAAILGVACLSYFFAPPGGNVLARQAEDWFALVPFLITAAVTSKLAAGARERLHESRRRDREIAVLQDLNTAMLAEVDLSRVLSALAEKVCHLVGAPWCAVFLPEGRPENESAVALVGSWAAAETQGSPADWADESSVRWVLQHGLPVGLWAERRLIRVVPPQVGGDTGSDGGLSGHRGAAYLPVQMGEDIVGVMAVGLRETGGHFDPHESRTLALFATRAALAVERGRLLAEVARAEALRQSDKLKSALLAWVSHDLRSPLTSIKAAATGLLDAEARWGEGDQRELASIISREADRLDRLVESLLKMSKLEAGALHLEKEWCTLDELVAHAVEGVAISKRDIAVDLPEGLPLALIDFAQMSQVLINLLENAIRYSPPGAQIRVAARADEDGVRLSVVDRGPGVPPGERRAIFEPFYRSQKKAQPGGIGLGLAICKGIVEAHGGRIWVEDAPQEGACVTIALPETRAAQLPEEADMLATTTSDHEVMVRP